MSSVKMNSETKSKIKVYNIAKLIESNFPNRKTFRFEDGFKYGLAIIEGVNGVLAFDNEGVGWKRDNTEEKITIGMTDIPKDNELYMMPQYEIEAQIKELMDAEYQEMLITEFIERYDYNWRLQGNYQEILNSIDEIGLNRKDYDSR